jgi:hypothetical protein
LILTVAACQCHDAQSVVDLIAILLIFEPAGSFEYGVKYGADYGAEVPRAMPKAASGGSPARSLSSVTG